MRSFRRALSMNLYAQLPGPKKEIVFKNCGHNDWPGDTPDSWLGRGARFYRAENVIQRPGPEFFR